MSQTPNAIANAAAHSPAFRANGERDRSEHVDCGSLSNDVRSEAGFADLVRFILGDTAVPYNWEYGDHGGKS